MQKHIVMLAFTALVLATNRLDAADAFPNFNISANCKAEIKDAGGPGETLNRCMKDEEQAKQQLVDVWAQFAAEDKRACIEEASIGGSSSYVELQTCLEFASENRANLNTVRH